jgi:hypothetical protein
MSLYDYTAAKRLWRDDTPFYALIMAAMYRADSTNVEKLAAGVALTAARRAKFPVVRPA